MVPTPVIIHHDTVCHIITVLRKRIGHAPCVRVIIERHATALPVAVIFRIREIGTEHDARHRIRRPFKPEVRIHIRITRPCPARIIGKRTIRPCGKECFGIGNGKLVRVTMVITCIPPHPQAACLIFFLSVLPYEVDSRLFHGLPSVLVQVVGPPEPSHAKLVCEMVHHETSCISLFRTISPVHIRNPSFFHFRFHGKVDNRLFLPVLDTCHPRIVALAVVRLYLFNHIGRQVFHRHPGVVVKKFLAVNHDFLHLLTVDGNRPVFRDLSTGQFLHQLFQSRAFGHSISTGIVNESIRLHFHLCLTSCHFDRIQYSRISLQKDGAHCHRRF